MLAVSVGLLVAALFAFLASTQQMKLWLRLLVWISGGALLLAAVALVFSDTQHNGLFRAVQDLVENWDQLSDSVIVQAFGRNAAGIGRFILPLLDLFILLAVAIGVLTFLAFTPGQGMERFLRPLIYGFLGAIGGGAIALAVVGVGFGGVVRPRAYANMIEARDILDGDTFWIGEVQVRLHGADAPERRQTCFEGGATTQCGQAAGAALRELLGGALVTCRPRESSTGRLVESFGRPLVSCDAKRGDDPAFDVAAEMVRRGYAVEYRGQRGDYDTQARIALRDGAGLLRGCMLRPDIWRNDRRAREAFAAGRGVDSSVGLGCSTLAPSSDNPR